MDQTTVAGATLRLEQGDITRVTVDAIVNAANAGLRGGGGVDGAIHQAAGPSLLAECARLGGCPPGEGRLTSAGALPARYVIHAVGPIWAGGQAGEANVLARAYRASLALAEAHGARTIAFPRSAPAPTATRSRGPLAWRSARCSPTCTGQPA